MYMSTMFRLWTVAVATVIVGSDSRIAAAAQRPSIVWIMADDLGWGEIETFPGGSDHGRISTPNLNQMAKEGMQFRHAYAGYTVCAPSRTTLFTGRHSGMFPKYNLSGTSLNKGEAVTLAELLKDEAGYATALFGKSAPLTDPLSQGFDAFVGQIDQAKCHNMYPRSIDTGHAEGNYNLSLNWKRRSRDLCMDTPEAYNYTTDVFQQEAISWLDARNNGGGDRPFFLYLSFTVPHAGGWSDLNLEEGAPVPTDLQYANQTEWPNVEKDHASAISYLDRCIGDILAALKRNDLDETLVFVASDNGAHLEGGHDVRFFNSTGGLRGHKRSMYEGGHRSPTIVRWPGHAPAGVVSDAQWSFWDVLPTFADLAGISTTKLPKDLSGRSIARVLDGETIPDPSYLFFTGSSGWAATTASRSTPAAATTAYAVRSARWKGVVAKCNAGVPSADDEMELFDLDSDPFETTNVASDHPDEVGALKRLVLAEEGISCNCFQC